MRLKRKKCKPCYIHLNQRSSNRAYIIPSYFITNEDIRAQLDNPRIKIINTLLYQIISSHLVVWRAQVVRCISLIRSLREGNRALVVREGGGPELRRIVARLFGALFLLSCAICTIELCFELVFLAVSSRLPCGGGSRIIGGISESCRFGRSCLTLASTIEWVIFLSLVHGNGFMKCWCISELSMP